MPAKTRLLLTRHALVVALVYLLVRALPDCLLGLFLLLPPEIAQSFATGQQSWLRHIYPVLPLRPMGVPGGLHLGVSVLPVLLIEGLLVFLGSAWLLRRVPAAVAEKIPASRWLLLAAIVLVWACLVRQQLLGLLLDAQIEAFRALRATDGGSSMDEMAQFLLTSHWKVTAAIYASTVVWAGLPVWLHFRFLAAGPGLARQAPGALAPQRRPVMFAAFLLGCATLHVALVQALYMGLWPWLLGQRHLRLPTEKIEELGLPLTLAQIVLALLACAAAAGFHVRGPRRKVAWDAAAVGRAVVAGMAAYLLTSLLLLAATWGLGVVAPDSARSFLRGLDRDPDSAWVPLILLNLLSVLLLWWVSDRLRRAPRACAAALAALLVLASIPAYVTWTLTGTRHGLVGAWPGAAITGMLGDARWREMQQWCTGVVETRHGTWLVGRQERPGDIGKYVPAGVPDLAQRIGPAGEPGTRPAAPGRYGATPVLTTLARLQDDGTFRLVATLPAVACMMVAPDGETLYLFTDLNHPQPPDGMPRLGQRAVLRSVDHGGQWEWLASGFMPETRQQPVFGSDVDVWAWGVEPADDRRAGGRWGAWPSAPEPTGEGDGLERTALFHSSDQGRTAEPIRSPEALTAPLSYLQDLLDVPVAQIHPPTSDMDRERFVVQVDETRAYAWTTERIAHGTGASRGQLSVTTRARLTRPTPQAPWQVTDVSRMPRFGIGKLATAADRSTHALVTDESGTWLARLDPDSGDWVARQRMPELLPGWLADQRSTPRHLWSNGQYQVVTLSADVHLPAVLSPFSRGGAEISADPHFYTRDGGKSWQQLAIPGYLGVMGLSREGAKLYWSPGNWYLDDEPVLRHYDLAR